MAHFDLARYELTIAKLEAGLAKLDGLLLQVRTGPDSPRAQLQLAQRLTRDGRSLLDVIRELAEGNLAPVHFYRRAVGWTDVTRDATAVGANLDPTSLPAPSYWQGRGADAYERITPSHVRASERLGEITDRIQVALTWSAVAGLAFYAGIAVVLYQVVAAVIACGIMALTGVFALPAMLTAIGTIGIGLAQVLSLVSLLTNVLGATGIQISNLHQESADQTAFPHGSWPPAVTGWYDDATVTDGDADWSVA
jgi:hypothetical protein